MIQIPDWINVTVNCVIAAMLAAGPMLLALGEAKKRNLRPLEGAAFLMVSCGFFLFAFWENFRLPFGTYKNGSSWFAGWVMPLFLGAVFANLAVIVYKYLRRGNRATRVRRELNKAR